MSTAAQIDFQLYFSLLATDLLRFSIPGIGSFVWHVERSHVDPKAGTVSPPRPSLKYEPGYRYQGETVAFLRDHFGITENEAETLLREIGRLTSTYLKAAPELELWRLGKLKRIGGTYKVELVEEAHIPFAIELQEVSLRAGAVSAVTPLSTSPVSSEEGKSRKEKSRARPIEDEASPAGLVEKAAPSSQRRRWLPLLGGVALVVALLAVVTFLLLKKRKPPQPVEISLSARKAPPSQDKTTPVAATPPPSQSKDAPQVPPPSVEKSSSASPPKAVEKSAPPPVKSIPSGPKYYIIVGSYPSRAEAEQKAAQFSGYKVEYLPGKEPGWVRLSIYSSTDKGEVQVRLREIKAQVPDAWVFAAP
ncbi:MAG: SPOR domain-containing protein [Bacteroidia bacterium]|nr:SPOR domain-containing protein [Bacteroidia bacterium]